MDLTKAVMEDLVNTLSIENMKPILEIVKVNYQESIEDLNSKGKNPDGKGRKRLSTNYARKKTNNPIPDFFLTGTAKESLEGRVEASPRSNSSIASNLDIFYEVKDKEANDYMYAHEVEDPYEKERRQFPIEIDSNSAPQKKNIKNTAKMIESLLMRDRQIVVYSVDEKGLAKGMYG
jgi:hypothetical protein